MLLSSLLFVDIIVMSTDHSCQDNPNSSVIFIIKAIAEITRQQTEALKTELDKLKSK